MKQKRKSVNRMIPIRKVHEACENCQTPLKGPWCHSCGQKVLHHQDNFWHLILHFIADYFHYDGKFWNTFKTLFTHPGQATLHFLEGRRASYLPPVQLYIFSSAVFFILFFKFTKPYVETENLNFQEKLFRLNETIKYRDSVFRHATYQKNFGFSADEHGFLVNSKVYYLKQYDSVEKSIPWGQRDHGLQRILHRKLLSINEANLDASRITEEKYFTALLGSLPKALFIILPLFALFLKLFYRRRPFVHHIIFSLHFHVMAFFMMLAYFVLYNLLLEDLPDTIHLLLLFFPACYLFLSFKRVYPQKILILAGKFLGFSVLYSGLLLAVTVAVFLVSLFLIS